MKTAIFITLESAEVIWDQMWIDGICVLDIPSLNDFIGEVYLDIYINGKWVGQWVFSLEQPQHIL